MDYSISDDDITQVFKGTNKSTCKIMLYKNLVRVHDLDNYLRKHKAIFVLYEYEKNYGHWTLLLLTKGTKQNSNREVIEFFDSYGMLPDSMLHNLPLEIRDNYGLDFPYVLNLLYHSKLPVEFNNHKLQRMRKGINTCGRWCIMRYFYSDLNIDQFYKLFKNKKYSLDKTVTIASDILIH